MIRRIITLVIASAIVSAGLLYLGVTMMEQYSPALAASWSALVAKTNPQVQSNAAAPVEEAFLASDRSEEKRAEAFLPAAPVDSLSANTSGAEVTIAQLFNNPDQFRNQKISISGIATSLGNYKVLLNDGTGQILVEVEDELVNFTLINGLSITVIGVLDNFGSSFALELNACMLNYLNNTVVIDDCKDDDMDDDDDADDDDDDMDDDDDDADDDDDIDDDDDDADDDDDLDDNDDTDDDDDNDDSHDDDDDDVDDDNDDGEDDDEDD